MGEGSLDCSTISSLEIYPEGIWIDLYVLLLLLQKGNSFYDYLHQ